MEPHLTRLLAFAFSSKLGQGSRPQQPLKLGSSLTTSLRLTISHAPRAGPFPHQLLTTAAAWLTNAVARLTKRAVGERWALVAAPLTRTPARPSSSPQKTDKHGDDGLQRAAQVRLRPPRSVKTSISGAQDGEVLKAPLTKSRASSPASASPRCSG